MDQVSQLQCYLSTFASIVSDFSNKFVNAGKPLEPHEKTGDIAESRREAEILIQRIVEGVCVFALNDVINPTADALILNLPRTLPSHDEHLQNLRILEEESQEVMLKHELARQRASTC